MKDFKKDFGSKVKEYRKLAGLTQENLAEKAKITVGTISGIETGYSFPSYPVICAIVDALNIPLIYLFTYNQEDIELEDKELQAIIVETFKKLSPQNRKLALKLLQCMAENE